MELRNPKVYLRVVAGGCQGGASIGGDRMVLSQPAVVLMCLRVGYHFIRPLLVHLNCGARTFSHRFCKDILWWSFFLLGTVDV